MELRCAPRGPLATGSTFTLGGALGHWETAGPPTCSSPSPQDPRVIHGQHCLLPSQPSPALTLVTPGSMGGTPERLACDSRHTEVAWGRGLKSHTLISCVTCGSDHLSEHYSFVKCEQEPHAAEE